MSHLWNSLHSVAGSCPISLGTLHDVEMLTGDGCTLGPIVSPLDTNKIAAITPKCTHRICLSNLQLYLLPQYRTGFRCGALVVSDSLSYCFRLYIWSPNLMTAPSQRIGVAKISKCLSRVTTELYLQRRMVCDLLMLARSMASSPATVVTHLCFAGGIVWCKTVAGCPACCAALFATRRCDVTVV